MFINQAGHVVIFLFLLKLHTKQYSVKKKASMWIASSTSYRYDTRQIATNSYLPCVTICGGFSPWRLPNGNFERAILSTVSNKTINLTMAIGLIKLKKPRNNIKMYLKAPLKVSRDYGSHFARETPMGILKSWQVC